MTNEDIHMGGSFPFSLNSLYVNLTSRNLYSNCGCFCFFLPPHQSSGSCSRTRSRCVVCVVRQLLHAEVLSRDGLPCPDCAADPRQLPSGRHPDPPGQTGRPQHPQTGESKPPLFKIIIVITCNVIEGRNNRYSHASLCMM